MLVAADVQDTVTAEVGTVGQPLKPAEAACTVKLQFPGLLSRICQRTDALALPGAAGVESGFVTLKVMVEGLTMRLKPPAAWYAGTIGNLPRNTAGRGVIGRPAAANNTATDSQPPMGFKPR